MLNAPVAENSKHEFGAAALAFFEATVNDGGVLSSYGVDLSQTGLISVNQSRTRAFNMIMSGSTGLSVELSGAAITGITTNGFLNVNLSSRGNISFSDGSDVFISNLLFDDPTVLLGNTLVDDMTNVLNFSDGGGTDVNSTVIGNFAFDSISVSEVTAVPVPMPAVLLLAGLVGLGAVRRRRS